MNIFVLDYDQSKAAKYHNDQHCIKQTLETAQLLCSAHHMNNSEAPYKLTHKNHPCSIWVRESLENYKWLCLLGINLSLEYTRRFGRVHKSQAVIEYCIKNVPKIEDKDLTDFALAMPDYCKTDDVVESYRNYYINEKQFYYFKGIPKRFTWSNSSPYWFRQAEYIP